MIEGLPADVVTLGPAWGIDLTVNEGELLALLGPSGSGKTTLLRLVEGGYQPDAGNIRIGADDTSARHAKDRSTCSSITRCSGT